MKDVDAAALVELRRARESLSLQYHERDESTMACTGLEWQCRFPDTCSLQFTERPRVIQRNAVSSALFLTFNSVDCSYRTEKSIVHVFFFFFFFFCEINRVSRMKLLCHCVETSVSFPRIRFSVWQRSWKLRNRLSRNGNAKRTNSRADLTKYRGNRLHLLG